VVTAGAVFSATYRICCQYLLYPTLEYSLVLVFDHAFCYHLCWKDPGIWISRENRAYINVYLLISSHLYIQSLLTLLSSTYISGYPTTLYTANPPLFFCLGSAAASNVPFSNLLIPCVLLSNSLVHVILCPFLRIYAVVSLSYPTSKSTCAGSS
jgi:hypothetical protein